LDEISMARFNNRLIIPAMVIQCRPPLCIYRIDYVDLTEWKNPSRYEQSMKRIIAVMDQKDNVEGLHVGCIAHLKPLDFGAEVARFSRDFIGRERLLAEIDSWLEKPESRVFFIIGDPGAGKSAIMARLVERHPQVVAYHFCISGLADSLNPNLFVRSIAAQLATQLDSYRHALESTELERILEKDPGTLMRRLVADPLKAEQAEKPVLILVDALDEASDHGQNDIAKVLYERLDDLPSWVRLVLSSRKVPKIMDRFNQYGPHEIDASENENLQDISAYLEKKFSEPELASLFFDSRVEPKDIAALLCKKGDGNFLYVTQAVEAIKRGRLDLRNAEAFPEGLIGVYSTFFNRLYPGGEGYESVRQLLGVLLVARQPLSIERIVDFLELDDFEVRVNLQKLAAFFPERNGLYQAFHKSVSDWLQGKVGQDMTFVVNVQASHRLIADKLLAAYQKSRKDEFIISHLPSHLRESRQWDKLVSLLTDFDFIEAKCRAGLLYQLILDYMTSLESMPKGKLSEKLSEYYSLVDSYSHIFKDHPEYLYNVAAVQPDCSEITKPAREKLNAEGIPWIHWANLPQAKNPYIRTLSGHLAWVRACCYSPDGQRIVSASSDNTLKIWNARTGRDIVTLAGHSSSVLACGFSPDGRRVVSASRDNTLKIWSAETGEEITTLVGHSGWVSGCSYSPDGKNVVSASWDKTLKIWDEKTGTELATLLGHTDSVSACVYSSDGHSIVSASDDKMLKIWDARTATEIATLRGHNGAVIACSYSANGRHVVSASWDRTLKVWDVKTHKQIFSISSDFEDFLSCSYSPDGRYIVSALGNNSLKIWDAETYDEVATYCGHSDIVFSCSYSPDGRRIVSASKDSTLKIWNAEGVKGSAVLSSHSGLVTSCNCSPDERYLVSASEDKTLKIWDIETGKESATLRGHSGGISACSYSPDGRRIVSASRDETLKIWDAKLAKEVATLPGHSGKVLACHYSPDGRRIVSASVDQTLKTWDAETGEEIVTLRGHNKGISACSYSPDGKRVVSASWDETLKTWEAETGKEIATLRGHSDRVIGCSYSPDGRLVGSISWDQTLRIWNGETGQAMAVLRGHSDIISSFSFSPDGQHMVSASKDKTLRIWNVAAGSEVAVLSGHSDSVISCAYSPDGRHIVSTSDDSTLQIWDAETGGKISALCPGCVISCFVILREGVIAAGNSIGSILILKLKNMPR